MDKNYLLHNMKVYDDPDGKVSLDVGLKFIDNDPDNVKADVTLIKHEIIDLGGGVIQETVDNVTYPGISLIGTGGGGGGGGDVILLKEFTYTVEAGDTTTTAVDIGTFNVTNDIITEELKHDGLLICKVQRTTPTTTTGAYDSQISMIPIMNTQTSFSAGYVFKETDGYRRWLTDGRATYGFIIHGLSYDYPAHTISITIAKQYSTNYTPNWDDATYDIKIYLTKI